LTALTAVELEHTELLGPTKELIAYDKLDACRTGGKTVVSNCIDETLKERILAYSRARNVEPLFLSEEVEVTHVLNSALGQSFSARIEGIDYQGSLALLGGYQVSNAMTAAFCVAELTGQKCSDSLDQMRDCIWPGRMEKISDDPSIWVDVGHTPDAIEQSVKAFREFIEPEDALVVFGVSDNKEVESIASVVRDNFPNVFLTAANKNGASVQSLEKYFEANGLIGSSQNIFEAARTVSQKATEEDKTVLVLGGLFLAVEFKYALGGGDPKELVFF
jgi:dihydrofolate synthase/folylpolyglutamate synthase